MWVLEVICAGFTTPTKFAPRPSSAPFIAAYVTFGLARAPVGSKVTCAAKNGAGDGLGTILHVVFQLQRTMAALILSLLGLSALLLTASGVVVQLTNENFDQVASKSNLCHSH